MSLEYWVWLSLVLGYNSRHLKTVLKAFSDPKTAYRQRNSDTMRNLSLPISVMKALNETTLEQAFSIIELCNEYRVKIIPYNSSDYPEPLRQIDTPPTVLYAVGNVPNFSLECSVAMVGTRSSTEYGRKAAFSLAYRLAKAGCLIISGFADGIDRAAHLGALSANCPTVAFLPYGHGNKNSRAKSELLNRILASRGCLLSEVPPKSVGLKNAYHLRNRLISGVAAAVVIVQAPAISGALITARCAIEQNKEIFAVTGRSGDASFAGNYKLVREGATPLFETSDILDYLSSYYELDTKAAVEKTGEILASYNREYSEKQINKKTENNINHSKQNEEQQSVQKVAELPKALSSVAAMVYNAFSIDGDYVDSLVEKTGLGSGQILSAITELEIFGLIKSAAGGKYMLA